MDEDAPARDALPGNSDAADPLLSAWCSRYLGSPAVEQFFGLQRLSSVHGLRLADGRHVVLKVREASPRWQACTDVHRVLWASGIPCPQPLVGPVPLVAGPSAGLVFPPAELSEVADLVVNAETWEGEGRQGVAPGDAASFAAMLARMVAAAPPIPTLGTLDPHVPWLWWDHGIPERIWCAPASYRWDPHRIVEQMPAEVVEAARRAKHRLLRADFATLPLVAGHGDFEAQNCRWVPDGDGGEQLVVHDWDSVVARPEAVLAGNSASTFVARDDSAISSIADTEAFLAGYEAARGRPFSDLEREIAWATGVWVGGYNSAFEYLKEGPAGVTAGMLDQAEERLRRAGA